MIGKKINKKLISEEEDENDLIINNDDDFYGENDLKFSQKKNLEIKVHYNPNKDTELQSSQKIEVTNESKKDERSTNRNIFTPVPNNQNTNINPKETVNEEKTIFSKITEDLYLDNKLYLKPKKIYFDISKAKEDNYNKLTIENYLFTCADKENSKNTKIINDFLERKTKEQNNKKIGNDPEKDEAENLLEVKRVHTDRKKEKNGKHGGRSPDQFLKEQKILEEKQKNNLDKLIKKYDEEEKNFFKDKPTISKQSEKIVNMKKIGNNKDIHVKLYEEYNIKKQKMEEKNKNYIILYENMHGNKNKKINNEEIIESSKRLYKDYEKRRKNKKENAIKKLNDIKNMSAISLVEKKSNVIINKKLLNKYKNELHSLFNKGISDIFDISFSDYLSFIYKLGLVQKDYSGQNNKEKNINISTNNNFVKNFNSKINNIETDRYNNNNIKNKIIFSQHILKRNTFSKSRSVEKYKLGEESEFNIVKNSWKIITKNKNSSNTEKGNSRRILYFILSVLGIFKGDLNDLFIKRELPFLSREGDKSYFIEETLAKQIYKYFYQFRNMTINNISVKNKDKETDKTYNMIVYTKANLKDDSISIKKHLDNEKNRVKKNYKNLSTSKSNKKIDVIRKIQNNLNKNKSINNSIMEKKEKSRYESRYETKAHNKIKIDESESILNTNNTQQNLSNLKKNLKPRIEKIKNDRINLNKGICSNSTKNINSKAKKYNISNNNYNSNNNIKINNRKNSNMYQKKIKNKEVISPQASVKFPKQNNSLDIPQLKRNKILSNQLNSKKAQEKILLKNKNEEKNRNKTNEKKPEIKSTKEESKHQKEKKSSISNYIFKEDYRIKDDIESNSNLNNLEDTEKNGKKKITSQDFSQSEFKIEKNEDLVKKEDLIKKEDLEKKENLENNMTNKVENTDTNEPKNLEQKKENVNEKKDKKKFIFKIRIKDNMIKLVINKGDDIKAKINAFCKENDLDEDDKEEILKAININLNA
jgi:unconventional prefoldin RPB5 interactor 1